MKLDDTNFRKVLFEFAIEFEWEIELDSDGYQQYKIERPIYRGKLNSVKYIIHFCFSFYQSASYNHLVSSLSVAKWGSAQSRAK